MSNRPFHQIAHMLAPGASLHHTWQLAGGISATMTALELAYPGGRTERVIVRQPGIRTLERDSDAASNEYRTLELARSLGLQTQAPLLLDLSCTVLPTPYLVFEYIEGELRFVPPDSGEMPRQAATELAAIHRADVSRFDVSFLPRQTVDAGGVGARPEQPARSLYEGRIGAVIHAARPQQRNEPALLHGDYWPGNVLWRNGKLVAVIDWEDARLGDPLVDLAIARLDYVWIFGTEAMDSFTEQYRAHMPIDYTDLAYWDLVAALRFVRLAGADLAGWAAFFEPYGRPDITATSIREQYGYFVAQALQNLMV